jgi:hypothetical protein
MATKEPTRRELKAIRMLVPSKEQQLIDARTIEAVGKRYGTRSIDPDTFIIPRRVPVLRPKLSTK